MPFFKIKMVLLSLNQLNGKKWICDKNRISERKSI